MNREEEFQRELDLLAEMGLRDSALRLAYEDKVRQLSEEAKSLLSGDLSEEEIARTLHQRRRDIGKEYKEAAPPMFREYIYAATARKYGDPLGPTYEDLRKKKTPAQIIQSASRPIEDLSDRLTVEGFRQWYERTMDLWGSLVEVDREVTQAWYEGAGPWGCTCGHCRNYLALAEKRQLPEEVLETLDSLSIPPGKATYVCELFTDEEGIHYQFSYRIAGRILEQGEEGMGRCCHEPYPHGAPNFPEPHFDLEFFLTLPWVLEESRS